MDGMAGYTCPKCGAVHDGSGMPPRYPWSDYTFRCHSCAAMLTFSCARRMWFMTPFFCAMMAADVFVIYTASPYREPVFGAVAIMALIAILVIRRQIPLKAVVRSDE
jgi:hypothetical protein